MRPDQIWQAALGELQLQLARSTYDTWLSEALLLAHDPETNEFVIGASSEHARDWLENRLGATLLRTLSGISGRAARVRFVLSPLVEDPASLESADSPDLPGGASDPEPWTPDWAGMGIPPVLEGESLDTLDWFSPALHKPELRRYLNHALDFLEAGLGLTLIGPTGVGKSHIAVGLVKRAVEAGWTAVFAEAAEVLARLRAAYDDARQCRPARESEAGILHRLVEADLLVLDDLEASALTPWACNVIGRLVRRRWNQAAPIIVTTNHMPDELAARGLDDAVLDRLTGSAVVIALTGASHRAERKRQALARVSTIPLRWRARSLRRFPVGRMPVAEND